jgi:hypothetical protein
VHFVTRIHTIKYISPKILVFNVSKYINIANKYVLQEYIPDHAGKRRRLNYIPVRCNRPIKRCKGLGKLSVPSVETDTENWVLPGIVLVRRRPISRSCDRLS